MPYNTRNTSGGGNYASNQYSTNTNRPQTQSAMRGIQQNFVSAGQFATAQKPVVQMPAARQQQQQPQQQLRQPHQTPMVQQQQQQQQQSVHKPQTPLPPAPLKSALKKEPVTPVKIEDQQVSTPVFSTPKTIPVPSETMLQDTDSLNGDGKKKFWLKTKAGKISKKERRGRRNQRLRRILQPKNALMVLNELIAGSKYTVSEKDKDTTGYYDPDLFVAAVNVDGQEYIGTGKSKTAAKTAAAESALKHIILSKLGSANKNTSSTSLNSVGAGAGASVGEGDGSSATCTSDVEMRDAAEAEEDVSWLHIASFAMHKLFASWDSDGVLQEKMQEMKSPMAVTATTSPTTGSGVKNPAKSLPANPETMNPVMLLNQMRPGVSFSDVAREGPLPHTIFTMKITLDGEEFFGRGTSKKLARKNCAFAACTKLFNINYPPEMYAPVC